MRTDDDARPPLLAPPDLTGPKVILGIVWAVITGVALITSSVVLGLWLALAAGLAATQAARSWKRHPTVRPFPPAAGAGALVAVLGACAGVAGFAVCGAVALVGAGVWAAVAPGPPVPAEHGRRPPPAPGRARPGREQRAGGSPSVPGPAGRIGMTLACLAVPAAAAAAPVLLRSNGLVPALVLMVYALVHDASAFVMGAGARRPWEGPVAGVASIASVTLAVAAIFPQFKGASPWILGLVAAVLTPLGPVAASALLGSRRSRVPAVRRLDSLMVLGPLWALAAALLVG